MKAITIDVTDIVSYTVIVEVEDDAEQDDVYHALADKLNTPNPNLMGYQVTDRHWEEVYREDA